MDENNGCANPQLSYLIALAGVGFIFFVMGYLVALCVSGG